MSVEDGGWEAEGVSLGASVSDPPITCTNPALFDEVILLLPVCVSQELAGQMEFKVCLSFLTGIVTHTMTWKRMKTKM